MAHPPPQPPPHAYPHPHHQRAADLEHELRQVRAASGPAEPAAPGVARFIGEELLRYALVLEVVLVLAGAVFYFLR